MQDKVPVSPRRERIRRITGLLSGWHNNNNNNTYTKYNNSSNTYNKYNSTYHKQITRTATTMVTSATSRSNARIRAKCALIVKTRNFSCFANGYYSCRHSFTRQKL